MRHERLATSCIAVGLFFAACSLPVQHGLDETAANEVASALERGGIASEKIHEEGAGAAGSGALFSVRVARADVPRAMELLRSMGLPRGHRNGFAEVYGQPSLVPSASEERARYLEAQAGELARTLETVEGVVGARVHLVPAETDPLSVDGKPRVPAQAAVLLKTRPGPAPIKETDVQKLVAGSVPGLQPGSVAVVITPAPEWPDVGAQPLAAIGPLRVSKDSRTLIVGGAVAGLALIALLAALLLVTARRLAGAQRSGEAGSR